MFGFLKNKKKDKYLLRDWHIPVDASYTLIDNVDSVQFVNAEEGRYLYFSILRFTGDKKLSDNLFGTMQPSIKHTEDGWQFKGAVQNVNQMLVCVFSFKNEADTPMMKAIFENIRYMA